MNKVAPAAAEEPRQNDARASSPAGARSARHVWLIVLTGASGNLLAQLSSSMAQVVLPRLETAFDLRMDIVSWVSLVYFICLVVALPTFGRLSDVYGRRPVTMLGCVLFTLGSLLSGMAGSIEWLIAARVLSGIGAGMLLSTATAIIVTATSPEIRGRALGIQSAFQGLGLCLGSGLGGFLIGELGWRWAFWAPAPAGVLGFLAAYFLLPREVPDRQHPAFDTLGLALLTPGAALFFFGVSTAGSNGLTEPRVWVPTFAGLAILALFLFRENRARAPLVDLSYFRRPSFVADNLSALLCVSTIFAVLFLMPFAFERGLLETVTVSGLMLMVLFLCQSIAGTLGGALADRFGARIVAVVAPLIMAAGIAGVGWELSPERCRLPLIVLFLAIAGTGRGLFGGANTSLIMQHATPQTSGMVGGLTGLLRTAGMTIAVSLTTAALAWQIRLVAGTPAKTTAVSSADMLQAIQFIVFAFVGVALASSLASVVGGLFQPRDSRA